MQDLDQAASAARKILKDWKATPISFGSGSLQRAGELIGQRADNALVVTGQGALKRAGVLDRITGLLDRRSIRWGLCEKVEPNPSKETVYRLAYRILAGGYTCLLAVGGGSVIDAAKAASILAALKPDELDQYFGVGMVTQKSGKTLDLIAVPTTSGSGSEVTKFAIITDTALKVKKIILDAAIVPAAAVVDPELTYSLSRHVTLVSGLDAMTHLMEGYLNTADEDADPNANQRALIGLTLLFAALPRLVKDSGDRQARELMSLAATLGGTVLYFKQAGGPHLNSFSWCNVMDHGEACAVMLPYYGAYYAPAVPEKLAILREMIGAAHTGDLARDFAQGLLEFYAELGFPTTLKEFPDFTEDLIAKAVNDASQNAVKLKAMPRPITLEQSKEVLAIIIQGAYQGSLDQITKL